jgi:hypothetical protein
MSIVDTVYTSYSEHSGPSRCRTVCMSYSVHVVQYIYTHAYLVIREWVGGVREMRRGLDLKGLEWRGGVTYLVAAA